MDPNNHHGPPPYSYGGYGAYPHSHAPQDNNANANVHVHVHSGSSDYFSHVNNIQLPSLNDAMDNHHHNPAAAAGPPPPPSGIGSLNFDILAWHPAYQSCQRFFLDHAQHEAATQAVCALLNIRLPFQWQPNPITSSQPSNQNNGGPGFNFNAYGRNTNTSPMGRQQQNSPPSWVSPVPYIRRLVVTGFDNPAILHGFFGDDYIKGVMPHVECERRNYFFAAKHGGWSSCKKQYDSGSGGGNGDDESLPFMKPMARAEAVELDAADQEWSKWLAFEDWKVGPRAVEGANVRAEKRNTNMEHALAQTQAQASGGSGFVPIKVEEGVDGVERQAMDDRRHHTGMMDGYGSR
ncbi:uncharacterized protein RCC_10356 [Ramularia collo-cygni]|uniref:Uncharacterized protein n=1 Tax=Ramularia collo-cygni TaxID=112498 RepID=A0A2D3VJN7_9PEZI|nr:uncharacterized protein RCC_10356 [Ramularia collo-cygni]CZT24631.1 uncharacterized protein RCC_10356 [Ramularia collo-cygni]